MYDEEHTDSKPFHFHLSETHYYYYCRATQKINAYKIELEITRSEKMATKCFIIWKKRGKRKRSVFISCWFRSVVERTSYISKYICRYHFESCLISNPFGAYDNEYFDYFFFFSFFEWAALCNINNIRMNVNLNFVSVAVAAEQIPNLVLNSSKESLSIYVTFFFHFPSIFHNFDSFLNFSVVVFMCELFLAPILAVEKQKK